ncbi:MAG: DUF4476 domain-containing protein [Bacteroidetes bacterium]|nr:DUF4476 domain-containing protein [Bacteroidota bacterium]
MARLTLVIGGLFWVLILNAQQPIVTFFTASGEKFFVVMDGKPVNTEAMSRVENVALDNDWAKVRISFEDENIPPIEKTIQGKDADGNISSVTWEISQNNKGKWVVRPSSWKKIESGTTVTSVTSGQEIREEPTTVTSTTTHTTTTFSEEPSDEEMNISSGQSPVTMSINMNDQSTNANVSINMTVPGGNVTQTQTQTQTTYTTVVTTTETNNSESLPGETDPLPGYNGRKGCTSPMGDDRFAQVKESVSSMDFEDSKLTVARQVLKSNCLFASQVKQIMMLFDFESTRLDFAMEAYSYTYDIDNYYLLNDAFDFESSVSELNDYINNK